MVINIVVAIMQKCAQQQQKNQRFSNKTVYCCRVFMAVRAHSNALGLRSDTETDRKRNNLHCKFLTFIEHVRNFFMLSRGCHPISRNVFAGLNRKQTT